MSGTGLAAVVAVAALALTGCSSDSSADAQKEPVASSSAIATGSGTPTATGTTANGAPSTGSATSSATGGPTASGSAADADTGGASTDSTQSVEGVWLATVDGAKVQLVLGKGKAGLTSTHLCGGAYTGTGSIRLTLTCMDGDKERTSGHGVMAPDGKTLTVQWTGGLTDTFSRTGLPSS
ncbi:hypothetical protein [Actinacidiphila guanduensis]|uniref:hypothetical protein n=1 Tax=Actinacidiphila guanduensis TaxID=310781 RepID=UPI00115F8DA7|nr:hypothetical protein [Actinacidiphila guanduensis]